MAKNLLIMPKFAAFDTSGNPLAGGLLYTYAAGTTTPLATYTTQAGTIANANPVVLDANGEADVWLNQGADYKLELRTSAGVVRWTEDNIPSPGASDTTVDVATEPGGRLTLTSLTPVTTADVTAATTVYYTPYKHGKVPLYDGSAWTVNSIATELSQATSDATKSPAATTAGGIYDVFVWDDAGTLRATRGPAWTAPGVRGTGAGTTELERLNGRYVNKISISNGPLAQRGLYVGTIFSDISANQIFDSNAKRYVWNCYNRVVRKLLVVDATNNWAYSLDVWRQARATTTNQLEMVIGLSEDIVSASVTASGSESGVGGKLYVGIGLDSTTTNSANLAPLVASGSGLAQQLSAVYSGFPDIGRHYLAWLERSNATGTGTFWGTAGISDRVQSGIIGQILA